MTLLVAAVYELTPLKDVCLGKCRSPLGALLGSWRNGLFGAVRMGAKSGAWCVSLAGEGDRDPNGVAADSEGLDSGVRPNGRGAGSSSTSPGPAGEPTGTPPPCHC